MPPAWSQTNPSLEWERSALSLEQSLEEIQSQNFVFRERGLRWDFFSIQSCLFAGEQVLMVQNYCFPQRSYPARGMTLFSRSFGVLEFYEETQGGEYFREIRLLAFPQDLSGVLEKDPSDMSLQDLNRLLQRMRSLDLPACWSSNSGFSEPGACYREDPLTHQPWLEEAQVLIDKRHLWPKPPTQNSSDHLTKLLGHDSFSHCEK